MFKLELTLSAAACAAAVIALAPSFFHGFPALAPKRIAAERTLWPILLCGMF